MKHIKNSKVFQNLPIWLKIIVFSILGIVVLSFFGVIFGFVIMLLWNWLMPVLFKLPTITYWQGIGIFVLAKIIFKSTDHQNPIDKNKHSHYEHSKFNNWMYYDKWWDKEGKKSFNDFIEKEKEDKKDKDTNEDKDDNDNIN